jgi:hydrogenase nickel incorporation protein HypA/HybF
MAENATLEVEHVPVVCQCKPCNREFSPDGPFFECPDCGQPSTSILRGREMELISMEVVHDD